MSGNPRKKNSAAFLSALVIIFFTGLRLSAQCVPDTENCIDTEEPGQFCPMILPNAVLNIPYEETITVIPPSSFVILGTELTILHIEIDSVNNLPPGIDYFPNADTFFAGTAYCIELEGTPGEVGEFTLAIYITATVDIFGTPTAAQVVDDTSIVLTVKETVGIEPDRQSGFRVSQNAPNPFSETTRLAYFAPAQEEIELLVYNILGVMVYQESVRVTPGQHTFNFDGGSLDQGTYFYRVIAREGSFTGKLVKTR